MSAVYPYICRDDLDRLALEDEQFQALLLGRIGMTFLRSLLAAPRKEMLRQTAVTTVPHLGPRTFEEIGGEVALPCSTAKCAADYDLLVLAGEALLIVGNRGPRSVML
jgi:hypothetical protein